MPTVFSHAAVPLAIGLGLGQRAIPRRLLLAGIVASMLPDADVLAFKLGIPYADNFGHRGASHSLLFALFIGLFGALGAPLWRCGYRVAFLFVALATASHPLLDMFTNGGMGVAFWWPISDHRWFAPWQVIEVSPIAIKRVLSPRGLAVMWSELTWVWLPASLCTLCLFGWRRSRQP